MLSAPYLPHLPTESPDPSPIARMYLRAATHEAHVRLNHHPLIVGITRDDYPVSHYQKLLSCYHRFYQMVEGVLASQPALIQLLPDLPLRWKTSWLTEDLHFWKVAIPAPTAIDLESQLVGWPSLAACLGLLYPLEGATLGGQVVSMALNHRHILPNSGGRFFHGYGEDSSLRWSQFELALTKILSDEEARKIASANASCLFVVLERMLDEQYAAA